MDLNNGSKCQHTIFHFDFIFVSSVFQGCGSWHHWSDLLMLMFINVGHNSICISLLLSLQRCDKNTVDEASLAQKVINYYILKKMENYMDFVINRVSQQISIKIQFCWEISFDEKLVLVIIQFCWEITFAENSVLLIIQFCWEVNFAENSILPKTQFCWELILLRTHCLEFSSAEISVLLRTQL